MHSELLATSREYIYIYISRLWNKLPAINLNQSCTATINAKIHNYFCQHFTMQFTADNPCTYHFCRKYNVANNFSVLQLVIIQFTSFYKLLIANCSSGCQHKLIVGRPSIHLCISQSINDSIQFQMLTLYVWLQDWMTTCMLHGHYI